MKSIQHTINYGSPVKIDLTNLDSCKCVFENVRPEAVVHSATLASFMSLYDIYPT